MKLLEQYSALSGYIFNLQTGDPQVLDQWITSETINNTNVYKHNLIQGAFDNLRQHYPATFQYLGEQEFKGLCAQYLSEVKLSSANINEFTRGLPEFFQNSIHHSTDLILTGLAQIDRLWSFAGQERSNTLSTPVGLLKSWLEINETGQTQFEGDFQSFETIEVVEHEGEFALKLKTT